MNASHSSSSLARCTPQMGSTLSKRSIHALAAAIAAALTADGTPQGKTPLEEGKLMSAEECALHLARALQKRRSQKILTFLGKATVWAHRLFPNLTDRLTYGYIAREADSPFK